MQVQNNDWKMACLAKWDQECQVSNGGYAERKKSGNQSQTNSGLSDSMAQIVHKIKPGDTIEGLSLVYNVNIDKIKARNNIESNQIYYLIQLIIPNPKVIKGPSLSEQRQQKVDYVLRKLKLTENQEAEARRILEQTSWNVRDAITKHKKDLEWARKYADILCSFENNTKKAPFFDEQKGNTI